MPEPTITVLVTDEGGLTLDTAGFEGRTCQEATEELMRRLQEAGLELGLTAQHLKPELALEPGMTQRHRLNQR